jgi:hypothetical protein
MPLNLTQTTQGTLRYLTGNFEVPDQQASFDAWMAGLFEGKRVSQPVTSLSSLQDLSLSSEQVEALSVSNARQRGVISETSEETFAAFSYLK